MASFSLENWKSFKVPVKLSLVAGNSPRNGRIMPRIEGYNSDLLPLVSIYGGNASGKSNFCDAMQYVQSLVVNGNDQKNGIRTKPFKLDDETKNKPSKFKFEIFIDEILYNYSFSIYRDVVLSESLYKISHELKSIPLFIRENKKFEFGEGFDKVISKKVANKIPEKQLFLHNINLFEIEPFKSVFEWFAHSLLLIGPESKFGAIHELMEHENPLIQQINNMLFMLDTGVIGINKKQLSSELVNELIANELISEEELAQGSIHNFYLANRMVSLRFKDGEVVADQLTTQHSTQTGEVTDFDISEESDGTKRLVELLPAFFDLTQDSNLKVLIIDEFDRSLHSRLTKNVIERYLELCNDNTRTQLIFTTHDQSLISDLPICNDEICVTDRDIDGITRMISVGDYKDIGKDENILDLYKVGLLGGTPNILFECMENNPFVREEIDED